MGFKRNMDTVMAYRTMRAVEQSERRTDPQAMKPETRWQRWQAFWLRVGDKAAGIK
jgi:hypothetical protein